MRYDPHRKAFTTDWMGLDIACTIIVGDWEGDPQVPNGVHYLPPYIDELSIKTPDGFELYDYLTESAITTISDFVLEDAENNGY
jgi:hypothetical protein